MNLCCKGGCSNEATHTVTIKADHCVWTSCWCDEHYADGWSFIDRMADDDSPQRDKEDRECP